MKQLRALLSLTESSHLDIELGRHVQNQGKTLGNVRGEAEICNPHGRFHFSYDQ